MVVGEEEALKSERIIVFEEGVDGKDFRLKFEGVEES
jgi:hypothetical protein